MRSVWLWPLAWLLNKVAVFGVLLYAALIPEGELGADWDWSTYDGLVPA